MRGNCRSPARLISFLADRHEPLAIDRADRLKEVQPPAPRHLFVEKYHAVGLPLEQDQCIVAVGARFHSESLFFQGTEDVNRAPGCGGSSRSA